MDHIEQQYLPWNPVPESANHEFDLGVEAFVGQLLGGGDGQVVVVACAPKPGPPDADYRGFNWWRIRFEDVRAFRYGDLDRLPVEHGGAWEVCPSRWMSEALPPGARKGMHHYAISDNYVVYELLAAGWSSGPLPAGWQEVVRADEERSSAHGGSAQPPSLTKDRGESRLLRYLRVFRSLFQA